MDGFDDLRDAEAARLADLLARRLARPDPDVGPDAEDGHTDREAPAAPSPASQGDGPDAELAELAALGDRLADLGPSLRRIAESEERFSLAFAARLRRELLAAHPAQAQTLVSSGRSAQIDVHPPEAVPWTTAPRLADTTAPGVVPPAPAGSGMAGAGSGERWSGLLRSLRPRRLLALVALAAAIGLGLLVHALASGGSRPAIVATGASATPQRLARVTTDGPFRAAQIPRATSTARPPIHAANSIAPRPDASPSGAGGSAAGVRPTALGGLQQRSALGFAPPAPPTVRYRLPARLPALPTHAVSYTLRYRPLDASSLASLVARFPSLRAVSPSSGARVLRAGAGGASLRIVLATGEVSYRAAIPVPPSAFGPATILTPAGNAGATPPASPVRAARSRPGNAPAAHATPTTRATPSAALVAQSALAPALRAAYVRAARAWLVDHGLFPAGVASTPLVTALGGGRVQVRFFPVLPLPLQDGQGAVDLSVDFGQGNRILAAHVLWPRLLPGASRPLPTLAQSLGHAPPGSALGVAPRQSGPISATVHARAALLFAVSRVRLLYVAVGAGPAATLQPAYLLQGTLLQPAGSVAPYSQLIPAG